MNSLAQKNARLKTAVLAFLKNDYNQMDEFLDDLEREYDPNRKDSSGEGSDGVEEEDTSGDSATSAGP